MKKRDPYFTTNLQDKLPHLRNVKSACLTNPRYQAFDENIKNNNNILSS
jgi:hypothetical protein